jgi:hypothetical protein
MVENTQPRIGIVERERASQLLQQHLAADRITFAEFDERTARVQAATTQAQIDAVLADLPSLPDGTRRWRRYAAPAALAAALLLVVVAVTVVVVGRSGAQPRTIVVTSVAAAPVASLPPVTTTTAATSSTATTTAVRTTTATAGASGTPFPGVLYLMDAHKLDDSSYYSFDTGPGEVSGTTYTRSIMLEPYDHRLAYVEYDLGRKYIHLDATLGVRDDAVHAGMSMQFQIYADGIPISDTTIRLGDVVPIHLDFDHPLRLRLQATDLDPNGSAYAVFGDVHTSAS